MIGEPDAGNPHVRFDEGVQETCDTRGAPAPYSTRVPREMLLLSYRFVSSVPLIRSSPRWSKLA